MLTHRNLIGLSLVLLIVSLVIGVHGRNEIGELRAALSRAVSSEEVADHWRMASEKKRKTGERELKNLSSKVAVAEARANNAQAELEQSRSKKAELESKLKVAESQITDLRKQVAAAAAGSAADSKKTIPIGKLKAELEETKQRMEAVEQENAALKEKVEAAQDRGTWMDDAKTPQRSRAKITGIHGTVLAVNQAYNFVVLSMGERQGVVLNSEMFIMRNGTLIGKIRISSVEPTTSIGDIISNSLARGVQVQPGDTVIYAGNASS